MMSCNPAGTAIVALWRAKRSDRPRWSAFLLKFVMGTAAAVAAPLHEHDDKPKAFKDRPIVAIAEADELRNA